MFTKGEVHPERREKAEQMTAAFKKFYEAVSVLADVVDREPPPPVSEILAGKLWRFLDYRLITVYYIALCVIDRLLTFIARPDVVVLILFWLEVTTLLNVSRYRYDCS